MSEISIPPLTAEEIAALPPIAPGHARHIMKYPVATVLKGPDGETVAPVTYVDLRMRVKGKDMRATDQAEGPMAKQFVLLCRLSGLPLLVFDEMAEEDVTALLSLQENPMPPGQRTGSAPSG